jgi:hypothetical protein
VFIHSGYFAQGALAQMLALLRSSAAVVEPRSSRQISFLRHSADARVTRAGVEMTACG